MFCKNCGKQIADDSKFCQYCGSNQEDSTPTNSATKKVIEIPTIKTNLNNKQKKWVGVYAVWVLLNFSCIFIKGEFELASNYFFPFQSRYIGHSSLDWDLVHYDFSEFLVYAILLPLVFFLCYKYRDKIKNFFQRKPFTQPEDKQE